MHLAGANAKGCSLRALSPRNQYGSKDLDETGPEFRADEADHLNFGYRLWLNILSARRRDSAGSDWRQTGCLPMPPLARGRAVREAAAASEAGR